MVFLNFSRTRDSETLATEKRNYSNYIKCINFLIWIHIYEENLELQTKFFSFQLL